MRPLSLSFKFVLCHAALFKAEVAHDSWIKHNVRCVNFATAHPGLLFADRVTQGGKATPNPPKVPVVVDTQPEFEEDAKEEADEDMDANRDAEDEQEHQDFVFFPKPDPDREEEGEENGDVEATAEDEKEEEEAADEDETMEAHQSSSSGTFARTTRQTTAARASHQLR